MPTYVFTCDGCGESFERMTKSAPIQPIKTAKCQCGGKAPRDMGKEGCYVNGLMKAGTGKGSLADTTKFAFGMKEQGGRNVSKFESATDLDNHINGKGGTSKDGLGPPVIERVDDVGNPVFAKDGDGNVLHSSAKLVHNPPPPSRQDNPKRIDLQHLEDRVKEYTGEGFWDDDPGDSYGSR